MQPKVVFRSLAVGFSAFLCSLAISLPACATTLGYVQTNLVSDIPGKAVTTDPNLINPWGMANSATSPYWVSDQGAGVATLYTGNGAKNALVVTIPATAVGPQGPTGVVFANLAGNFVLNNNPATFIFANLNGTISAWNGGTTATIEHATAGAVYTGLALIDAGTNRLYSANFAGARIDVFDSSFNPVTLGAGAFTDPNLPAGYAPYNIQNINGKLYVQYALVGQNGMPVTVLGDGFVDVFDANGNMLQRLISNGQLDAPWGIALAPAGFGDFANDLLVGNFGNGTINAFDPVTGAFKGTISDAQGNPIVNSGLWALNFGNGNAGSTPNTLFFNAGINGEKDGLFGSITPTPEPGTIVLVGGGLLALFKKLRKKLAR